MGQTDRLYNDIDERFSEWYDASLRRYSQVCLYLPLNGWKVFRYLINN